MTRSIIFDAAKRPTGAFRILGTTAVLTFVIAMTTLVSVSTIRLASILAPRLSGQFTVVIWGQGLESADAAAARAAERLSGESGIQRVEVLEASVDDALIAAALGGPARRGQLRLIAVDVTPKTGFSADQIKHLLNKLEIMAAIDDHRGIAGPMERDIWIVGGLSLIVIVLLVGGSFLVFFAIGGAAVLSINNTNNIDLLHRLGADADFIGVSVGRELSRSAIAGAVVGLLCATTISLAKGIAQLAPLGPARLIINQFDVRDDLWMAPLAVIVVAIAVLAIGMGASRGVMRRERDL